MIMKMTMAMSSIHSVSWPACRLATVTHTTSECWCGILSLSSRRSLLNLSLHSRLKLVNF